MTQDTIKNLEKVFNYASLEGIDYLLELYDTQNKGDDSYQTTNFLNLFFEAILNKISDRGQNSYDKNEYIPAIFNKNLSQNNKRFIAICLLRLLNSSDKYFNDNILRLKSINLFDEVFSKDLYPIIGLHEKQQTYEKISKLKDIVSSVEIELSQLVSSCNSIESIENFRQNFLKKVNAQLSKILLSSFIQYELVDVRLKQVFNIVEEYRKEEGIKKIKFFETAIDVIERYIFDLKQNKTIYSRDYLGKVAENLRRILQNDFNNNPLSKPASLDIEKDEKKYPFNIQSASFNLSFRFINYGLGQAFDVNLKFTELSENVKLQKMQYYLGNVVLKTWVVEVGCEVKSPESIALFEGELSWTNFDKSEEKKNFFIELEGQVSDINWQDLEIEEPYSLEPVTTEDELVGRTDILNQLIARAKAKSVTSSYISGQKRVGKTSIAKTLKTRLYKLIPNDYHIIYLEGGDYCHPEASGTIENLGKNLCNQIKQVDCRFSNLEIPEFKGALSPLSNFLEAIIQIAPDYRILFILDEFDELPIELYKRSPIGDAFFLTLRAISGKENFSFLLVGGEKMEFILSSQGDALNKFQPNKINYLENHLSDFQEFVRKPIAKWPIEISDKALYALYQQTGGNPYFTKQICKELFKLMVTRRDSHITQKEIEEATKITLNNVRCNSFIHFWEDGIFETNERAEEISMNRRKILLALAEAYRKSDNTKKEHIIEQSIKYRLTEDIVEIELREFERRQVLINNDDIYTCKVPFFGRWLKEKGINEIITTFTDIDAILAKKKREEEAYISSQEIVKLIESWSDYQGQRITEDKVRTWLQQFSDNSNQRLVFRILQKLKFYTEDNVRGKMSVVHGIVMRGLVRRYEGRQRSRRDIIVSYLDHPSKSGARYAKLYADENEIYYLNVIERSKLAKTLIEKQEIQALVFIDDFVGTGNSTCEYFKDLAIECKDILQNSTLRIFFIAITGFQSAQEALKNTLDKLEINVKVHICDPLDESAKAFSDKSSIFPNVIDRERAKNIAYEYGIKLVKNNPLGYGDCQTSIVFSDTCPNNSLPILWSDANNWIPLFKRQ